MDLSGTTALPAGTRGGTEAALSRVHRDVEAAMGQLCLALVRRRLSRGEVTRWVAALREAADELAQLAEQLRKEDE